MTTSVEIVCPWRTIIFGDCATLINGRAYGQSELKASGTYKVIRIQNLNGGPNWYYSDLELDQEKYCDSEDLLFAWSATFGPYIWTGSKSIFHYHIWKVLPRPEVLDREFAYFLLLWITAAIRESAHGIAMLHFTKEGMEQYEVSIPSLLEQCKIASRLKAQLAEVDTARQAAQAQLRDVALLRKRLMRQTFDALHDAPRKVLGDWAKTTSGSTPSRSDKRYWSPADIPWVKTGEVAFAPVLMTEESISRQAMKECSLTLLPPKTVLVAMYGQGKTRGQSAVLEVEATTNQACFAILPNDTWDTDFLYHWLMASYEDLRTLSEGRGGNQANLNGALLNALEIPAPDLDEQQRIVKRLKFQLAEVSCTHQAVVAQLAEIERLPQRILAQAFNTQGDVP